MMKVGKPKWKQKIHYGEWFLVVTSEGVHFYFDRETKTSYWQLADLFGAFPEIDQENFIQGVNFDDVALLMSRANGLKGLDDFYVESKDDNVKGKTSDVVNDIENETNTRDDSDTSGIENDPEELQRDYTVTEEELKSYVRDAGFGVAEEPEQPQRGCLMLDYSSESDSEGSPVEEFDDARQDDTSAPGHSELSMKDSEVEHMDRAADWDLDESSSVNYDNGDLDLSVSETDEGHHSYKEDFFALLDSFKEKISLHDPWFIVEEELLPQFLVHSSYYSVNEADRENFFNEWCRLQSERDEDESEIALYPSLVQLCFKWLQKYKKHVRKSFFSVFFAKYKKDIDFDMATKEIEDCFLLFKILLKDYSEYEAKNKDVISSNINLKKRWLEDYLKKEASQLPRHSNSFSAEIEKSTQNDFDRWVRLCNTLKLPVTIANNVNNFIVADEKRFQTYIEFFTGHS